MDKKNIVIIDSSSEEGRDFVRGLEEQTHTKWELVVKNSNDRRTKMKEFMRYVKYFWVPFCIFINRNRYDKIVAWQQFYGIMFAFYCRIFRVKKTNKLVVMSFIYKEKSGLKGKLYRWMITYAITSKYIDAITSVASVQCEKFTKDFGVTKEKFQFVPWGITDIVPDLERLREDVEPYFFCAGRSNRDWSIVFDSLGNTNIPCKFIYSDKSYINKYKNIEVRCNVPDDVYFGLSINSYCVIISIDNCHLAGGEITILNAMQFGKPVILIQDEPNSDYVIEGITGFVVPKNKEAILSIANRLRDDYELREMISANARKVYEEKFTIYSVGKQIGKLV